MKTFSQRIGKSPIKSIIQMDSMDDELRTELWNNISINFWANLEHTNSIHDPRNTRAIVILIKKIWIYYFNSAIDELPSRFFEFHGIVKKHFMTASWEIVYDFVEFLINNYSSANMADEFRQKFIVACNSTLKKHLSGYRIINDLIAAVTSDEEIKTIEEALLIDGELQPVSTHLNTALRLMSDRNNPDYRNSIKESISALESYCVIITQEPKATLGQALKKFENLHPALKSSFNILYGYTSDADGIRHALLEEDTLRQEDAVYMLVACSAFINYLRQKAAYEKSKN